MVNESPEKLLLSAAEVAGALGITRQHWYGLLSSGKAPLPLKLGRRSLWRAQEDIKNWVSAGCPNRERWELMQRGNR